MSEETGQGDVPQQASGTTAGTLLREAREAAGLHVAALAVSLKVPVRKLEALEADRLDLLPDAVFVRALAASVCRTLKIDPAPVLALLPQTGAPRLADSESGINAPFRSPSDGAGPSWLDQLSRPVFLAVFALLLGALVLILLPATQRDEAPAVARSDVVIPPIPPTPMVYQPPSEGAVPAASSVTAVAIPQATSHTPTLTLARPATPASAPAATTVTKSVSPSVMPTATATAAKVASAPAPVPAASAPAASTSGLVVFKARAQSWIQVTDAKGTVTLRKLLMPGETAGASGTTPLVVTVGSANGTEVEVRGKPMNLAPYVRDNVARFEVK
ncbi:MAG: helix-turn-helix domain-containing protein [Burkholderiales bacterium]|nr:helix-turn-helix domain-containing protein [Burkholderiales bacterium]